MQKVFVISLHRCATQSAELFLRRSGLKTCHWPAVVKGINYQAMIVGLESDPAAIFKILRPVFDEFDAFDDVPLPALYRELDAAYPDARFIAIRRNTLEWVQSVRRHCSGRSLEPYEKAQYWCYLSDRPTSLDQASDGDLVQMFERHYQELETYFESRNIFILGELNDPKLGDKLTDFLACPRQSFPYFDYKKHRQAKQGTLRWRAGNLLSRLLHRDDPKFH